MVDFEFDEKHYKRVDVDRKKFILVDHIQGSKMFFNRYPFRDKYDVYYGMIFYGCFPAGTKIICNNHTSRNIESIKVGDKVLSYNEKTGEKEYKEVTRTFVRDSNDFVSLKFSNGNNIRLTPEHPIATIVDGKIVWKKASDILVDDKVLQKDSPYVFMHSGIPARSIKNKKTFRNSDRKEISKRISERNKIMWADPNSAFNSDVYKKKKVATLDRVGNGTVSGEEINLGKILQNNFPDEWIYNDTLYIGACKPDFIHNSKKKVIEWNGCYYHGCTLCGYPDRKNSHMKDSNKLKIYKRHGYDCLTLWEHQSESEVIRDIEKFLFNPGISVISVVNKTMDFVTEKIGYVNKNGWVLKSKKGAYSIWETTDGFVVLELFKRKEFFANEEEANVFIEVMSSSYKEKVYNLEVVDNNNYFAYGILVHNCWEPILTKFIKNFVKPKMKVADVGVYLGYYSLMMARLVGDEGVVHAFEPSSDSIEILDLSAKVNDYDNIESHEMALSNFDGVTDFDDSSFLIGTDKDNKRKITVNKLDSLDIDLDFIKIDTDGYDGNVVAGAMNTIKKNGTVVALEYFPQMWAKVGIKPSTFFAAVSSNNLNLFVLEDDCKLSKPDFNALLKYPNIQHLKPEDILKSDYPDVTLILSTKGEDEILAMCK